MTKWLCLFVVVGFLGCGESNVQVKTFDCEKDSECKNSHVCQQGECKKSDKDNDTWAKGKDCDDNNPLVYPGAAEICDNKADDNCNGKIDEEPCICKDGEQRDCGQKNTGECKAGRQTCNNGKWEECKGSIEPSKEDCDGKDNDCDGKVDENLKEDCYAGPAGTRDLGICKSGTRSCKDGSWEKCQGDTPPLDKELCNGKDDDCDGVIDNGLERECYDGPNGTKGRGPCKGGKQFCTAGKWSDCKGEIKPVQEDCDGQDNDCDGMVDEGLSSKKCYNGPTSTKGVGQCREGIRKCDGGAWTKCTGEISPAAQETCNDKIDNNCDGNVDENCSTPLFEIKTSINTDSGKIDGILSPGWQGSGKFQLKELRIPQGARVKVTGKNPLTLTVQGPVEIAGTLDLSGKDGGSTNCSTSSAGGAGLEGGGGGGKGGSGGGCNISGGQPKAGDGTGPSAGKGGKGGGAEGGAGGGGGHESSGKNGLPSGFGGKGGLPFGSPTTISAGSGGGGGACGAFGSSILGVYTPGAGGGGGGGALHIVSTVGDLKISGNIIANGGDGGASPACGGGITPGKATGGGGGGGSGGSILLRAKGQITISGTVFLTASAGKGNGAAAAKGGKGSDGRIRFQDSDGKVTFPASRVLPAPTLATY